MSSNNKIDHDEFGASKESQGDHCKECNDYIEHDEFLAHGGCCHRCNPSKSKNIDHAIKEAGMAFYKQQAEELLMVIIKEDNPDSLEDLHNSFWIRLANDRHFKHRALDFKEPLESATDKLVKSGIFINKAA